MAMDATKKMILAMDEVKRRAAEGIYSVPYAVALRELVDAITEVSSERAFPLSDVFGGAVEAMAKGN
jgi:hypothetical protein